MRILSPINLYIGKCHAELCIARVRLAFLPYSRFNFKNMKTLKLKKYRFNSNGNLRSLTDDYAVKPEKVIEYYSFKRNDKEGTVVVTDGGEHHCQNNFNDVNKQVTKAR